MTEDTLKHLSLDELHELMILIISEYTALQKEMRINEVIEVKKAEIQLIQKMISERKNKLNPTH